MISNKRLSVILLALTCCSVTLGAATFQVTSSLDSGPGTLRQAILDANAVPLRDPVEIDLSPIQKAGGGKRPFIELTSGALILGRPMAITAAPRGPQVILENPNRDSRLLVINGMIDGTILIEGIHFIGGWHLTGGGAILYDQTELVAQELKFLNLEIRNCSFSENVAGTASGPLSNTGRGGAIFFRGHSSAVAPPVLQIADTVFSENAVYGYSPQGAPVPTGAALQIERAIARFDGVRFEGHTGNSSTASGGVIEFRAVLPSSYLRHCVFENNVIGAGSSIMRVAPRNEIPGTLTIDRCLIANNGSSESSNSILVVGTNGVVSELDVVNSTFYGNMGITSVLFISSDAYASLRNCTIAGNLGAGSGNAALRMVFSSSTLALTRSVIAENPPLSDSIDKSLEIIPGSGTILSAGYNFIGNGFGLESFFTETGDVFGSRTQPLDPLLAPLGDYGGKLPTMPPLPDSPLVDAIAPAVSDAIPVDARDVSRPQGNFADIGAVELLRIPYNEWRLQLPQEDRAGTADPDSDGLANSLEYFFGTDPAEPQVQPVRWVTVDGDTFVEFDRWTWVRPAYFSAWRLAFSEDLQDWEPVSTTPIVDAQEVGSIDYFRYRFPVEPETKAGFFRVEVE